jgi:hypothetical protein
VSICIKITATCFGVNTPSSANLQVVLAEVINYKNYKINIVVCCNDKILVNVPTYVIPG